MSRSHKFLASTWRFLTIATLVLGLQFVFAELAHRHVAARRGDNTATSPSIVTEAHEAPSAARR